MELKDIYQVLCNTPSDINQHLPILYEYGKECKHITEMGVRNVVSSWAFLNSQPSTMVSYDLCRHENVDLLYQNANNTNFTFIQKDVLKVEIDETDLLFIDTLHIYSQLIQELTMHSSKVKKYIILHDTVTYGRTPEPYQSVINQQINGISAKDNYKHDDKGIMYAVEDFLKNHTEWCIHHHYENNNGLTILKRN